MESNIVLKYFINMSNSVKIVKFRILDEHDIADFVAARAEDSSCYDVANNIDFCHDEKYTTLSNVDILPEEQLFIFLKGLCYPHLYDSRLYLMMFHDYEYLVMCYEGVCAVALIHPIVEKRSPSTLYKQFYSAREMRLKYFKLTDWTEICEIPCLARRCL